MTTIKILDNVNGYQQLLRILLADGERMTSRVGDVIELENVTIEISEPLRAIPVSRPKLNMALGRLEGAQLVAGISHEKAMELVVPRIRDYSDFFGSYGPRARRQLPILVDILRQSPDSRRAVLALWSSEMDIEGRHTDHPCTLAITFRIRDERLNMTVHMRSNDIWRGWAYDCTQFAILQATLANVLDTVPGTYVHHADSFHLYERDLHDAEKYASDEPLAHSGDDLETIKLSEISGFGHRGCTLEAAQFDARSAIVYPMSDMIDYSIDDFMSPDAHRLATELQRRLKKRGDETLLGVVRP